MYARKSGRSDTLGSGIRNLYKYMPIYAEAGELELYEDDVFKISIPLNIEAVNGISKCGR